MTVHDGLPCSGAAVYADVETLDLFILTEHLQPHLIEEQVDRAPLGLVEVEEGRGMPARHDQRVQRRHRMGVVERDGQPVLCDNRSVRGKAKEALSASVFDTLIQPGFASITGFSPVLPDCLTVGDKRINLNMAMRYSPNDNRTYVIVASPVIPGEY